MCPSYVIVVDVENVVSVVDVENVVTGLSSQPREVGFG